MDGTVTDCLVLVASYMRIGPGTSRADAADGVRVGAVSCVFRWRPKTNNERKTPRRSAAAGYTFIGLEWTSLTICPSLSVRFFFRTFFVIWSLFVSISRPTANPPPDPDRPGILLPKGQNRPRTFPFGFRETTADVRLKGATTFGKGRLKNRIRGRRRFVVFPSESPLLTEVSPILKNITSCSEFESRRDCARVQTTVVVNIVLISDINVLGLVLWSFLTGVLRALRESWDDPRGDFECFIFQIIQK